MSVIQMKGKLRCFMAYLFLFLSPGPSFTSQMLPMPLMFLIDLIKWRILFWDYVCTLPLSLSLHVTPKTYCLNDSNTWSVIPIIKPRTKCVFKINSHNPGLLHLIRKWKSHFGQQQQFFILVHYTKQKQTYQRNLWVHQQQQKKKLFVIQSIAFYVNAFKSTGSHKHFVFG